MKYAIKNGVEVIDGITVKNGETLGPQKIIKGFRITSLDKCYQMLDRIADSLNWEIEIMTSWGDYLVRKNIPFAITESRIGKNIFYKLFVHGTEIVRQKSESKKLP